MDRSLTDYLEFAQKHPQLFRNPPDAGYSILLNEDEIRAAEEQAVQRLVTKDLPTEWATVGIAYQDQYVFLLRDAVRFPDGSLGTYIRFVEQDGRVPGVIILPIYQGQVLLIRHFRHATRTWHLELPRGFGMPGLSGEENARRELEEEIGGRVQHIQSLGPVYPDAGASMECDELFYVEIETYGQGEAFEAITAILPVSIVVFEQMIRDNEVTDGFTLAAYARAKVCGLL